MHRRFVLLSLLLPSVTVGRSAAQAQQPGWQTVTARDGRFTFEITTPFKETTFYSGTLPTFAYQSSEELPGGKYGLDLLFGDIGGHALADVQATLSTILDRVQKRFPESTTPRQAVNRASTFAHRFAARVAWSDVNAAATRESGASV